MKIFNGGVAVITGAASGIGFALAERAAREGMGVVLADIEVEALMAAEARISALGAQTMALVTDVRRQSDLDALAGAAYEHFGGVNLLCNNAGVLHHEKATWEFEQRDWDWVFDVNVKGVVNGLRAFVPRMLESGQEGHIVNTASMAGLVTGRIGNAIYDASKHAVLSLSESLYRDLAILTDRLTASVLCPGGVATNIWTAERNRPRDYGDSETTEPIERGAAGGLLQPSEMADAVFAAIRENRFYVLAAQTGIYEVVKMGHDRMWEGKNPAVSRALIAAREARREREER
ncbi:MAG: SDR family NAD(P)-dependent oxidoreductase [Dehalococcoidia bacterium]